MSLESTATSARPKTKSLRATIPEGVVAFLNLESGDSLEWVMDIDKNERIVIVKKKRSEKKK
jgi:bifunctional DNA-binding transcriptional regulator/antitoxin component of YhaV-PrlF toxin-antitoxin module